MSNRKLGSVMLALGLALGSGATTLAHQPAAAAADSMDGMSMGTQAKSAGDREMNAVMDTMAKQMSSMSLTGVQDRDFMMMMIPHHMSAVGMAKIELRLGKQPQLKALAHDIISSQDREIAQMQGWLKTWYGAKM